MTGRPDPVAIRAAARQILRAPDDLEHDASVAYRSVSRLEGQWAGSAALVHAGAVGDYARHLRAAATAFRELAREATATAACLDRELSDLVRLESQHAALGDSSTVAVTSALDAQIAAVWSSICGHQVRFANALDAIDPRLARGRRLRCGPVRAPDLGVVDPARMRTGPVRPIGVGPGTEFFDVRDPGRMRTGPVRQFLAVTRPALTP